jgi:hypothetical protein
MRRCEMAFRSIHSVLDDMIDEMIEDFALSHGPQGLRDIDPDEVLFDLPDAEDDDIELGLVDSYQLALEDMRPLY